jgi:hypothetical protein
MREGAGMPSCYTSTADDLQETPSAMTGFPGAIELWPHQLAGAGRLQKILLAHFCALLAYEMGLGKTLIVIGQCCRKTSDGRIS